MVRSSKFFKYSLLILAVGMGCKLLRDERELSQVKSVEEYWAQTGVRAAELEDLISDQTCASSEKYFLACANAVLSVANRYNLQLRLDGSLGPAGSSPGAALSERQVLEPWKVLFNQHPEVAKKISFLGTWTELKLKYVSDKKMAFMIASGLNGFISIFRDPHTYLMPIAYYREVVSKTDNKTASLGIVLGRNDQSYFIRKVYPAAPAEKAGLYKGDILVAVEGTLVASLMPARVGELMRGEVGKVVKLSVLRKGLIKEFEVMREQNTIPTVSFRLLDGIKRVGVLTINKFSKQTCERTKEALQALNQADIRGLLMDLRDNPGGQMEEAACVASLFVGPEEKIFEIKYLDKTRESEVTYGQEEKIFNGRVAILINGGSASAAEIVAGALRDLNRAVLVGEKSFGKGSFQEGEVWSRNSDVALFETKGFYYLPSGRSPQMRGLEPDVRVDFKDALQLREVDQFMNPLHAPQKSVVLAGKSRLSVDDCLDMEDGAVANDDPQMGRARQALFCINGVAGVNQ